MGKLYKTLDNIEKARQNAVRNAKAAGLPATDEMSLNGLSELYRLQNNDENIEVETIEYEPWKEPNDWIDIKSILENEPNLVYNNVEYTPIFITLLTDDADVSNDILNNSSYDIVLKTSDGQIMKNTTISSSTPIVWDTTKDIPCSLGYNMRYIIYYWNTEKLNDTISAGSYLYSSYVFYNKPIIKVIYGNFYFDSIGNFSYSNGSIKNPYITVLDCLQNTTFRQMPTNSFSGNIYENRNLKQVTLRMYPDFSASTSSNLIGSYSNTEKLSIYNLKNIAYGQAAFSNIPLLRELNLPDLETSGPLLGTCSQLKTVFLPKLKTVTGTIFSTCYNLNSIDLPVIEKSGTICSDCYSIKSIILPTLKSVSSSYGTIVDQCYSLEELILPSLEEIVSTTTSYTGSSSILYNCNRLRYVQFPSLKNINVKSSLVNTHTNLTLDLPIIENISAAYITYGYSSVDIKINAPFLKSITLQDIAYSTGNVSNIYLVHNDPIDITLEMNYQSLSNWISSFVSLKDNNINHITFGRELNLATLQAYLNGTSFKKVTCKIKTGPTPTNAIKPVYLNNDNVLCRGGVELDLLDGSNMSTHTTINHNNLIKFLTNLISLPDGETRTLILGSTLLSKLSDEEKAIATNKGWVLE